MSFHFLNCLKERLSCLENILWSTFPLNSIMIFYTLPHRMTWGNFLLDCAFLIKKSHIRTIRITGSTNTFIVIGVTAFCLLNSCIELLLFSCYNSIYNVFSFFESKVGGIHKNLYSSELTSFVYES